MTKDDPEPYIPFGKEWEKETMKLPKKELVSMLRKALLARLKAADAVPKNWLDELLTGPTSVLPSKNAGRWGCPDIERLLQAIAKRLKAPL